MRSRALARTRTGCANLIISSAFEYQPRHVSFAPCHKPLETLQMASVERLIFEGAEVYAESGIALKDTAPHERP